MAPRRSDFLRTEADGGLPKRFQNDQQAQELGVSHDNRLNRFDRLGRHPDGDVRRERVAQHAAVEGEDGDDDQHCGGDSVHGPTRKLRARLYGELRVNALNRAFSFGSAKDETGYDVGEMIKAFDCFMSPGSVTERLTLYVGVITGPAAGSGGGIEHEGEDIEVIKLPIAAALKMVETGQIADAKTILLLQYAELRGIFG